jgi:hypothetical protein
MTDAPGEVPARGRCVSGRVTSANGPAQGVGGARPSRQERFVHGAEREQNIPGTSVARDAGW